MALAHALLSLFAVVGAFAPAGRIVTEWHPGLDERELGGPLVVDDYGINGLGAYQVRLDEATTVLAVCIDAAVGHSMVAEYTTDAEVDLGPELDYLTWAYLRQGATPTDEQAAAVNALAWRFTNAQRRGGGSVWQGDALEIRVLGVGRLTAVEDTVVALHAEATARRGPWSLGDLELAAGSASVRLTGPGGPIGGIGVRVEGDGGWSAIVTTDAAGTATVAVPGTVEEVRASVDAPGDALALVAPGSQRLATPGPSVLVTTAAAVPTTTSSTTTSSTTTVPTTTSTTSTTMVPTTSLVPSTTTTTTVPTTTSTTMVPTTSLVPSTTTTTTSTSSTTTTVPPTTTTVPATTTTVPASTTTTTTPALTTTAPPPPTLPRTGSSGRDISRIAAALFGAGAFAVLVATPRRRVSGDGSS